MTTQGEPLLHSSTSSSSSGRREKLFPVAQWRLSRLLLISSIGIILLCGTYLLSSSSSQRLSVAVPFGWLSSGLANGKGGAAEYLYGLAYWRGEGPLQRHPVEELILRGQRLWEDQERKRRNVDSLEKAVEDYRVSFGMNPPEGFDAWYHLAVSLNSTSVPSLLPTAHTSVLPFLAMPARLLRDRVNETKEFYGALGILLDPRAEEWDDRIKTISLDPISKNRHWNTDAKPILAPYLHLFPTSDPPLLMSVWTEDNTYRIPNGDILEKSREMARNGEVWTEEDLLQEEMAANGTTGCKPVPLPFRSRSVNPKLLRCHSFPTRLNMPTIAPIQSILVSCVHSVAVADVEWPIDHVRTSSFSTMGSNVCQLKELFRGGEMLTSPARDMNDTFPEISWDEKSDKRLVFRGGPTGMFHSTRWDWRSGQRDRAGFFGDPSHSEGKTSSVLVQASDALNGNPGWVKKDYDTPNLVRQYLDIGVVQNWSLEWMCGRNGAGFLMCGRNGEQLPNCPATDDTGCDEMKDELPWMDFIPPEEEAGKYKYRLDIDGFGWTARWRRQLSTGSVLLKASLYPEWWTEQMIPWYHYIPVQYDYSDLFNIMSFFTGAPGFGGFGGHDDLAEEIGNHGRHFAMNRMRWEALQSYMFLLLLEYRRAWLDDRQAATFHL